MTCEECKSIRQPKEVPYAALEIVNDHLKKVWITLLIVIFLLVGTNIAWLCYCSQFEVVETTNVEAEQDGSGTNIVSGGDLTYGADGQNNENP